MHRLKQLYLLVVKELEYLLALTTCSRRTRERIKDFIWDIEVKSTSGGVILNYKVDENQLKLTMFYLQQVVQAYLKAR